MTADKPRLIRRKKICVLGKVRNDGTPVRVRVVVSGDNVCFYPLVTETLQPLDKPTIVGIARFIGIEHVSAKQEKVNLVFHARLNNAIVRIGNRMHQAVGPCGRQGTQPSEGGTQMNVPRMNECKSLSQSRPIPRR